jgi:hypothetical protein
MDMTDSDVEHDEEIIEGDFVIVNIHGEKSTSRYIAWVDIVENDELE